MNKKGFTLTELILTIGLLAVLGMVIISNMTGLLEKNKEDNYKTFVETIENAACTFIDLKAATSEYHMNIGNCKSSGCNVKISDLVSEGLLTEKQVISPKTNEDVSSKTVRITYPGNKKTCKYNE